MKQCTTTTEILGPWSLATSREFWEGFSPSALPWQGPGDQLSTVFRVEADWSRAQVSVSQQDGSARIDLSGDGDLDAAAWRPYRTWGCVHLRALRERRTHEISG